MMQIRTAAALAAATLAVSGIAAQAQQAGQGAGNQTRRPRVGMQKLGWRLACQAWTFNRMTVFETLDTLKGLGVRYVEFFPGQKVSKEQYVAFDHNAPPEIIAAVKAKLQETNVRATAYGVVGLGSTEAEARKVFEFAKTMGMRTLSTEPAEETLPMLDKLAAEYKIGIAIHNHPKPSHYWSPETVLKATEKCSKLVGACADTGHWPRSGINPVAALKQMKGRIVSLHFKDLDKDNGDVPFGTGAGNAEAQLRELRDQGFKGTFSIEYERTTGAELLENVKKCVEWFRATSLKLAAEMPDAPAEKP
ncbi:MAG: sugar phosphate isomerase/epimerase [Armatimonadetes bacterium]|nr:sugar phosphate isomerase/epimerase [Armatimonadota bacterium]